jgi:hypothetical protein
MAARGLAPRRELGFTGGPSSPNRARRARFAAVHAMVGDGMHPEEREQQSLTLSTFGVVAALEVGE